MMSPEMDYTIVPCRTEFAAVVEIHRAQFPSHFVSRLSKASAARLFRAYVAEDCPLLIALTSSGDVLGYILGGQVARLDRARRRFIRRNAASLATGLLRGSGGRIVAGQLAQAMGLGKKTAPPSSTPYQLRYIAVRTDALRLGIASQLLSGFEAAIAPARSYHAWVLETRSYAMEFYRRRSFVPETTLGRQVRMLKKF
jgi:GNAT superfamily N-acetyltransferase